MQVKTTEMQITKPWYHSTLRKINDDDDDDNDKRFFFLKKNLFLVLAIKTII